MRLGLGLYALYITDLLRTVPRSNVLVINLQQYAKERVIVLRDVCDFLNLSKCENYSNSHNLRTIIGEE